MPISIVRAVAKTSTGTQDFTVSGFGTPKAAIFMLTRAASLETVFDGVVASYGATDGTNSICDAWRYEDNVATTNVTSGTLRTVCIRAQQLTANSTEAEAAFSAWITNGVRINWSTASANNMYVTCILFGGAEIANAHVGNVETDLAGTYDVTSPGFQPDLVFTWTVHAAAGYMNDYIGHHSMGIADRAAATNYSVTHSNTPRAATSSIYAIIRNDQAGVGQGENFVISGYDANGFNVVLTGRSYGSDLCWLALKFTGVSVAVKTETWKYASTGNKAFTGYGFKPNFLMIWATSCPTLNIEESDTNAGPEGTFAIDNNGVEYGHLSYSLDNAADSDEKAMVSDSIKMYSGSSSQDVTATWVSYDSDGYTFNFSAVVNTDRYCLVLALKANTLAKPFTQVVFL